MTSPLAADSVALELTDLLSGSRGSAWSTGRQTAGDDDPE